jgi:exodeoxyribonuclease VII large subunit
MSRTSPREAPAAPPEPGIPGSALAGPFPVGEYAAALRGQLRSFTRVQLVGELVNLRPARARVYFELRDSSGAIPCAVWQKDWDQILARLGGPAGGQVGDGAGGGTVEARGAVKAGAAGGGPIDGAGGAPIEGMQVVVAGGCDFYPGSATSSPGFSFSVADLRVAGEGDLLARIDRLRKTLDGEGLLARQQLLHMPLLPRTIGVITGESGKARDDILAALARRGWAGRLVWGFAPVQDRHAAPAIVRALGDLAAVGEVEVAIVARGGGSLADLLCFCDETLCRTVALLGVPVIASVGHHTDRTLLDDVAAISCSTPTHAAEAAIGIDCLRARADTAALALRLQDHARRAVLPRASLPGAAARLGDHGRRAVLSRARLLATLSRAPAGHLARQRTRLHQQLREVRAGSRRRVEAERTLSERRVLVLQRKNQSALLDARERHPRQLRRLALTLAAHDPQRTLERGYALVESPSGEPLPTAGAARATQDVRLRFADATVPAKILP